MPRVIHPRAELNQRRISLVNELAWMRNARALAKAQGDEKAVAHYVVAIPLVERAVKALDVSQDL